MAYRSDLEAAHARLDAMDVHRPRPCLVCQARGRRLRRIAMFFVGLVLYAGAFVLLLFASLAGFIAIVALLIGTVMFFSRTSGDATSLLVGIAFAMLSAGGFAAFFYLERLLRFDVGRFG